MKVEFDPAILRKLKKVDVRVRKSFKEKLRIFSTNPSNSQLRAHSLQKPYQGYRSIYITSDWRAIYKEVHRGEEVVAYFITLGTHKQLYNK